MATTAPKFKINSDDTSRCLEGAVDEAKNNMPAKAKADAKGKAKAKAQAEDGDPKGKGKGKGVGTLTPAFTQPASSSSWTWNEEPASKKANQKKAWNQAKSG